MDSIITLLLGVAVGSYYAESIRKNIPVLDPNADKAAEVSGE